MDHLAQDPDQKKLSGKHFPRLIHFLDLRIPEDLSLMVPCQDVSNLDIVIGQTDNKAGTIPVISSAHLRTNIYERIEMTDKTT